MRSLCHLDYRTKATEFAEAGTDFSVPPSDTGCCFPPKLRRSPWATWLISSRILGQHCLPRSVATWEARKEPFLFSPGLLKHPAENDEGACWVVGRKLAACTEQRMTAP